MLFTPRDNTDSTRAQRWREEKTAIARYADALLMRERGSLSSLILLPRGKRFLLQNAVRTRRDFFIGLSRVHCGRQNQIRTDAVIGEEALKSLKKYHFTKGFWGDATSAAATVLRCQRQAIRC